jgi:hypothetical protein
MKLFTLDKQPLSLRKTVSEDCMSALMGCLSKRILHQYLSQ